MLIKIKCLKKLIEMSLRKITDQIISMDQNVSGDHTIQSRINKMSGPGLTYF